MENTQKRIIEIVVLIIYTWLNIRIVYPFLFTKDYLEALAFRQSGYSDMLFLPIALFLNAALILYWLRKN